MKLRDARELFEGVPKDMKLLYVNDLENDSSLYCPIPAIEGKKSVTWIKSISIHQNILSLMHRMMQNG